MASMEEMLSQAAEGKLVPPPAMGGDMQTVTVTAKAPAVALPGDNDRRASAPLSMEDMLKQATRGQLPSPPVISHGSTMRGIVRNVGAGLTDIGAGIANVISDPVGNLVLKPAAVIGGTAYDAGARLFGYKPMTPEQRADLYGQNDPPQPGTQLVEGIGGVLGVRPSEVPTTGAAERLTRKIVGGAGMGAVAGPFGALTGGIGAVAGDQLAEQAPDWLKPGAELGGNVAAGAAVVPATQAATAVVRPVIRQGGMMGVGPKQPVGGVKVTGSQADRAAGQVSEALGQEGRDILAQPATQDQIVPGSMPTTAQLAPTPEAVGLEQAHRVATPAPFIKRAQEQNAARTGQIDQQAPVGSSAASVGAFFTQQLKDMDNAFTRSTESSRQNVQTATEGLGGQQTTAAYGDQIRAPLVARNQGAKGAESALWEAIDPDGKLALPLSEVQTTARDLLKEVNPNLGDKVGGQEHQILSGAVDLPEVIPFRDAQRLRANIGQAERELRASPGNDQSLRRLGILKRALDSDIAAGADNAAAADSAIAGRIQGFVGEGGGGQSQTGTSGGRGAAEGSAGAEAGVGGAGGSLGQEPGRPRDAGSNRGLASEAPDGASSTTDAVPGTGPASLNPNFDPEAARRYAEARSATLERKQTFGLGGVGQILKPGRQGAEFATPSGAVPTKIFTRGPTEPAEVAQFIEAVGGPEAAASIGRETLANELRQSGIIKADGTLDATKFARWQERRSATLEQFPGLPEQFRTAEAAQRTLDDVSAAHVKAVDEFERHAANHFIKDDPMVAVRKAFSSGNPTETFGQLVRAVRGNADAEGGLRRAVVDFIQEKMTSTAPAGTDDLNFLKGAVYRDWIDKHAAPLKVIFGGQGFQNLNAVGQDLRRVAQGSTATTGPDTAQKLLGAKRVGLIQGGFHGTALAVIGEQIGEVLAHMVGGEGITGKVVGATVGGGGYLFHALRQSGIANVNDLVRQAMLNPMVARELLQRVGPNGTVGPVAQRRIAAALQASLAAQAATHKETAQ